MNPPTDQELFTLRALAEMAQDPNSDAHQILQHMRTNVDAVNHMQQQLGSLQAQLQSQSQSQTGPITSLSAAIEALAANNLEQQQLHQAQQASVALILERLSQRQSATHRTPIPLPLPTKFKGLPDEMTFSEFKAKLHTAFLRFPDALSTDSEKINYAFQSMEGTPSRQLAPIVNGEISDDDGLLQSYDNLMSYLHEIYGDQHQLDEVTHKLIRLRQSSTMIEYITQFRTLSARTRWNEPAQLARFKDGLSDDIKTLLASQWHALTSLRDTMSAATTAYQNLQAQHRFRPRSAHTQSRPHQHQAPRRPPTTTTAASPSSGPTPMDLDAMRFKKLTPAEKQHRRDNGLCLYCGDGDHFASACPKKSTRLAAVSFDSENELA
jgi:hypothetical protein